MSHGILMAGGTGSRLSCLTQVVNKHLIPIDGKFIIDYSIDTLKSLGCQNITIVLGGPHFSQVVAHCKDGSSHNVRINYVYQGQAVGIAQGINICKNEVRGEEQFFVMLGDNIFSAPVSFPNTSGAAIALYDHPELSRFGVASICKENIFQIQEKPKKLKKSKDTKHMAVTGCYRFDKKFFEYFKLLQPSARGEWEISEIIEHYLRDSQLSYTNYEGMWSDAGTHESIEALNQYFYQQKHKGSI